MSGEGSLFDVPPAAFGRFRVLHQIGAGTTGPVFRGEDPDSGAIVAIKSLRVNLAPERAHEVSGHLSELVARAPRHPSLATPLAAGLSGIEPYLVTVLVPGQSLDVALRDYGPAAIGDLLPRLHAIADALDLAAERELIHGTLHPRDLLVSADESVVAGLGVAPILARAGVRLSSRRPYTAPELADGPPVAASDQFSLAAIAFEWMSGRRVAGPADSRIDFPALPGIDRAAIAEAFTVALAREPDARYETSRAFVDAVSAAVTDAEAAHGAAEPPAPRRSRAAVPSLPLEGKPEGLPPQTEAEEAEDEGPGMVLDDSVEVEPAEPRRFADLIDDAKEEAAPVADEADAREAAPAGKSGLRLVTPPPMTVDDAPLRVGGDKPAAVAWQATSLAPQPRRTFGLGAIIAASIAGVAIGFGSAYVVIDRQSRAPQPVVESVRAGDAAGKPPLAAPAAAPAAARPAAKESAPARATAPPPVDTAPVDRPAPATEKPAPPAGAAAAVSKPAPPAEKPAPPKAAEKSAAKAPAKPAATGSLLIRSVPPGAAVSVDGVKKGVTPLTVRQLALGTRKIVVERSGYSASERTVALTSGRPSQSIDVRLTAAPAKAANTGALSEAGRKAGGVEGGAAAITGSLIIDSRPSGARVLLNGRATGTTPLMVESLAPGTYEVMLTLTGYQPFTTSVEVTAGGKARAAGSLVAIQERE